MRFTPGPNTPLPRPFFPAMFGPCSTGIVLTLGQGNQLVCGAIELLGKGLLGKDIEKLMADFGTVTQRPAQHPQLRWARKDGDGP
jgi:hypothetical protein